MIDAQKLRYFYLDYMSTPIVLGIRMEREVPLVNHYYLSYTKAMRERIPHLFSASAPCARVPACKKFAAGCFTTGYLTRLRGCGKLLCFSASLLLCFSASLLLCFSAKGVFRTSPVHPSVYDRHSILYNHKRTKGVLSPVRFFYLLNTKPFGGVYDELKQQQKGLRL